MKKSFYWSLVLIAVALIVGAYGVNVFAAPPDPKQCNDNIDNDGDLLVDLADPGCANNGDDNETNEVVPPPTENQCEDGEDNDGDLLVDLDDPGCQNANDDDETDEENGPAQMEICHWDETSGAYDSVEVNENGTNGHEDHEEDLIPAPEEGCPEALAQTGSITIVKEIAEGTDVTDWSFSFTGALGGGDFSLSDETPSTTFSDLAAGEYLVNETLPEGWSEPIVDCDDENSGPGQGDDDQVVVLAEGENVTCTFTNAQESVDTDPIACGLTVVSDETNIVEETLANAVATYDDNPGWTASIPGATWIWKTFFVENPGTDETYTFKKTFSVEEVNTATLSVASDNNYEVFINGVSVTADPAENNFQLGTQENNIDVASFLTENAPNTIAVRVRNWGVGGTPESNPAGALYKLVINEGANEQCEQPSEEGDTILTIIKKVIGGLLSPGDFDLAVSWYTPGNTNETFVGEDDPGTSFNVNPGTFVAGENLVAGYTMVRDSNAGPRCSNATINEGEHLTCTILNKYLPQGGDEELSCQEVASAGNGWYGEYFNYPWEREDMYHIYGPDGGPGGSENWTTYGDGDGSTLRGNPDDSTSDSYEWYNTEEYFRFSRVDSDLEFGEFFFPFYDTDTTDGDPEDVEQITYYPSVDYHFGVHWSAEVDVPVDGATYNFFGKVDNNWWIYLNDVLITSRQGVGGPVGITGALTLSDGDIIDVYFAERGPGESAMYLEFLNNSDEDDGNNIVFTPHRADCDGPSCDVTYPLYADGSISCTGADDLSTVDGSTTLTPVVGGVNFTVDLTSAEPNRAYTIAISEEPSCGSAVFFNNVITTDGSGAGTYSGFYPAAPGAHNLLVNVSTDATGLSDPRHREIGTTDTSVVVPATVEDQCVPTPEPLICDPRVNLIENGGFEAPDVTNAANWDVFASGTTGLEWLVDWVGAFVGAPATANIELHDVAIGWTSDEGVQYAELDSDWEGPSGAGNEEASTILSQTITTIPGEEYELSYAFSPRPNTDASENELEVRAGGIVLDTHTSAGGGANAWTTYTDSFTATTTQTVVSFADLGTPNSIGTFLDDVALYCIPEGEEEDPTETSETIVVRDADLADSLLDVFADRTKWFFYNDETDVIDNSIGSFVFGPETAPLGDGSAQMSVSGSQRRNIATYRFYDVPLENIDALTFSTYSQSAGNGSPASERSAYLHFNVDFNNTDTWQSRLVYVPSLNGVVINDDWQTWDAINGGNALWLYSGAVWPTTSESEVGVPGTTAKTWNEILVDYPIAETRSTDSWFGFRVGEPYADGFTGDVDEFVITLNDGSNATTTTFDFEPDEETPPNDDGFAQVHIRKYIDNGETETQVPDEATLPDFPMHASWNATNIGAGEGDYVLGNSHGGSPVRYGADTSPMTTPVNSYNTFERTTEVFAESPVLPAGAECEADMFRLVGYRTATSLEAAEGASLSTTSPTFTNFSDDQYVIVVNEDCDDVLPPPTLTIIKNVAGEDDTFNFSLTGVTEGSSQVTTVLGTGTSTIIILNQGTTTITELQTPGWNYAGSDCVYDNEAIGIPAPSGEEINVDNGDNVTCTFTNTATPSTDDDDGDLGTVSGYKWNDLNGDGIWNNEEPALAGWAIQILGEGTPLASDITDSEGFYSITISDAPYQLCEIQQGGWTQTFPNDLDDCHDVSIVEGEILPNQNFGNQEIPALTGDDEDDDDNGRSGSSRRSSGGGSSNNNGEVLGATTETNFCPFLRDYLHIARENDPSEVNKAKAFLNAYLGLSLGLNGVFDQAMFNGVVTFQNLFEQDVLDTWVEAFPGVLNDNATGYVYQTTRWKINSIICPGYETFPDQLVIDPGSSVI